VASIDRIMGWVIGAAVVMTVVPAQAQSTNIDAGKSAAQIFADTCNACHRSARELRPTHAGFLRDHYTTGMREAASMAAYLASVGSDPRAGQRRPAPVMGAGRVTAPEVAPRTSPDQARNPETRAALPETGAGRGALAAPEHSAPGAAPAAAVKPRRPSESVEAGKLPVDAVQSRAADAAPAQATAAAPTNTLEEFEE
jgi:hypothetical protein